MLFNDFDVYNTLKCSENLMLVRSTCGSHLLTILPWSRRFFLNLQVIYTEAFQEDWRQVMYLIKILAVVVIPLHNL